MRLHRRRLRAPRQDVPALVRGPRPALRGPRVISMDPLPSRESPMRFARHGLLAATLSASVPACSSVDVDVFGGTGAGSGGAGVAGSSTSVTGPGSGGAPATTTGSSNPTSGPATTSTSATGSGGDCL